MITYTFTHKHSAHLHYKFKGHYEHILCALYLLLVLMQVRNTSLPHGPTKEQKKLFFSKQVPLQKQESWPTLVEEHVNLESYELP